MLPAKGCDPVAGGFLDSVTGGGLGLNGRPLEPDCLRPCVGDFGLNGKAFGGGSDRDRFGDFSGLYGDLELGNVLSMAAACAALANSSSK